MHVITGEHRPFVISKFMADPTTRDRAYRAPDAETLYALLTGLDAAARS